MTHNRKWWQATTIYQIYPRSYMDSNHDGIGDLRGIIAKLDHIHNLGFETIWFSPFYQSPQQDWGYDVSDYYTISPEYGSLEDAEKLIDEIHQRGMRVIFDMVMNHTSNQHAWFQESRSSRDNPKADWYIWRDGRGKRPPNNWKAIIGGSGWHYEPAREQWYYASFLPFQPDLNFRNPEVKQAMFDVLRFWFDKGVDGFRLDIFHAVYKDEHFRDNPFSLKYVPDAFDEGYFQKWVYSLNQSETFTLAKEIRALADGYAEEKLLIGELFGSHEVLKQSIGEEQGGLSLVFLWDMIHVKADAERLRDVIRLYEKEYPDPYTPVYVLGNHDKKRWISYLNGDVRRARLIALLQHTVRGVPVVYYGEEIGMHEGDFPAKTALDPVGRRYAWVPQFVIDMLSLYVNRDGCRTPMQWDDSAYAGFSSAEPWLAVHANHKTVNVNTQADDHDSLLLTYKYLLHLRKGVSALHSGSLTLIDEPSLHRDVLAYLREDGDQKALVLFNFGDEPHSFENDSGCDAVLFSTEDAPPDDIKRIILRPLSGLVLGSN